eukprot:gene5201-6477_t
MNELPSDLSKLNLNNNSYNYENDNNNETNITVDEVGIEIPVSMTNTTTIPSTPISIAPISKYDQFVLESKKRWEMDKHIDNDTYLINHPQSQFTHRYHSTDFMLSLNNTDSSQEEDDNDRSVCADPIVDLNFNQNVFLSSLLIPNRHELLNKESQLANGVLLSPFYHPITSPAAQEYYPPQCKKCYAFINMYCRLDGSFSVLEQQLVSPIKQQQQRSKIQQQDLLPPSWICSICYTRNMIDSGRTGVRSILDVTQGLGWWNSNNSFQKTVFSTEHYDIRLKKKASNSGTAKEEEEEEEDDDSDEEYTNSTISGDSIPSTPPNSTPKIAPTNPSTTTNTLELQAKHQIYHFIIDENISVSDLELIENSIKRLIQELPDGTQISLISFSKNISIYELNSTKSPESKLLFNTAKVIGGLDSLNSNYKYDLKLKRKLYLETLLKNNSTDEQQIEQQKEQPIRGEKFLQSFKSIIETAENNGESVVYESKPISLGTAIECALSLSPSSYNNGGRMFIFLNGAPRYGPGALPTFLDIMDGSVNTTGNIDLSPMATDVDTQMEQAKLYYTELGERAYKHQLAIDITMIGYNDFNAAAFVPLCFPSGYLHSSFQVQENDRSDAIYRNMKYAILKNSGLYAQLDIHSPEALQLTRVIGPTIDTEPRYEFDFPTPTKSKDRYPSFLISNLQQDTCFSIYYALQEDIPYDYIHIQFVIHLLDQSNRKISRIITKRIKTTGNYDKYLASVDLNVCSILLSKKVTLESLKSRENSQTKIQIDFDKEAKKSTLNSCIIQKGWFRNSIIVPNEINKFVKKLYDIRNGALFNTIIQNKDDFVYTQSLLLNSGYIDSLRLLQPKLLQITPDGFFRNIPLDLCAINPNSVLLFDVLTSIILFVGSNITNPLENTQVKLAKKYIKTLSLYRIPYPMILQFNEKVEDIRWLKSRLQSSDYLPEGERIDIIQTIYPEIKNVDQSILKSFETHFVTSNVSYREFYQSMTS